MSFARQRTFDGLDDVTERAVRAIRQTDSSSEAIAAVQLELINAEEDIRSIYQDVHGRVQPRFAEDAYHDLQEQAGRFVRQAEIDWEAIADQWMQDFGGALIKNVSLAQKRQIMSVVRAGVKEGLGTRELALRVQEEMTGINHTRARRIARTEVVRGSNFGQLQGARQTGLKMEKEWIATLDGRVRTSHADLDAERVPEGEFFTMAGTWKTQFPASSSLPARHSINCRCTLAYHPV